MERIKKGWVGNNKKQKNKQTNKKKKAADAGNLIETHHATSQCRRDLLSNSEVYEEVAKINAVERRGGKEWEPC